MIHLAELLTKQPILPFIRQSDAADRPPWSMPERRLLDYLLIYIQEGSCVFHIDGEAHYFTSGDFCLIQPNSICRLEGLTATKTPYAHFDIFYNPDREKSFPTKAGQLDLSPYASLLQPKLNDLTDIHVPIKFVPRNRLKFQDAMLKMVACWQNKEPLMQLKVQGLAMELVIALLEDHRPLGAPFRMSAQSLDWLPSYMSFHLMGPLSVESMAKKANLSISRFSALFKQQFSLPPHRYLLNMRISHAQELLENELLTQEDIVHYCGFADIHHFSKAFKSKIGCSPGQYRDRFKSVSFSH